MPGVLRTRHATPSNAPVAVVDVGSNSVRLVVYENSARAPLPIFNEKVLCGLGRNLDRTGLMPSGGVRRALESLQRFARLCPEMGASEIRAITTAAVREARNGPDFLRRIRRECGLEVRLLSGEREAELSAQGVVSAIPDASGLAADLGGASLELALLDSGNIAERLSLPFGTVRGNGEDTPERSRSCVRKRLDKLSWLRGAQGRSLFLVGGAWRALASIHMNETAYPLRVIHQYTVAAREAADFCATLTESPEKRLMSSPDIRAERLATLPLAAAVLDCLLEGSGATEVVFSASGLREGCLYEALSPEERARDPLLSVCENAARRMGRGVADGEFLAGWIAPALEGVVPERLRLAACHLSDIGWSEHPDYRAEQVFLRILRMPFTGANHRERVMLGLAVASRHAAMRSTLKRLRLGRLIRKGDKRQASGVGLAMRLAYAISGGAAHVLEQFRLEREAQTLRLQGPEDARILIGNTVRRRLHTLAAHLGLRDIISLRS